MRLWPWRDIGSSFVLGMARAEKNRRRLRVFIADDHAVVRDGLARLMSDTSDLEVAGTASDSASVVKQARDADWDVVVLDIGLPGAGGVEVLSQLKAMAPQLPVIIFTMHPEDRFAVRLLKAGAAGYLCKTRSPSEVLEAVRRVAAGGRWVPPTIGELLLDDRASPTHKYETLTDREYQVFRMILDGKDPSHVAIELHLSPSTVSTHIRRIKQKLGAQSTADVIRYGFRAGLID